MKSKTIKLRTAGHSSSLECVTLSSSCGSVQDGIAFEFGNQGGWVIDYKDLVSLVLKATELRLKKEKK